MFYQMIKSKKINTQQHLTKHFKPLPFNVLNLPLLEKKFLPEIVVYTYFFIISEFCSLTAFQTIYTK